MIKKYLYISLIALLITGCQSKDLSPQPVETLPVETTAVETTTEGVIEETEVVTEEAEVIIPTRFEVYKDGEPHYLMFYADEERTYFSTFSSVSRPELGVESVSFLTSFVDPENGILSIPEGGVTVDTQELADSVYDFTDMDDFPDNEMHLFSYNRGICGIFSRDLSYEGEQLTETDLVSFLSNELHLLSNGYYIEETTDTGDEVYVMPTAFKLEKGDGSAVTYAGFCIMRMKDQMAQGVYYCMATDNSDDVVRYMSYTLQSLEFVE